MSRLLQGSLIILCFLMIGVVAAFITNGATSEGDDGTSTEFSQQCDSGNFTNCGDTGKSTFFDAIRDTAVGSFGDGTPLIVSVLWILGGVFLLSVGVLLIVSAFIPTLGF